VLHDITIAIPSGAIVGLIGPSGCGKTTLVQILTGMITPTAGQVRVFENDPATFTVAQRTRLGYMPQLPVLFPNLTVWENLNFAASMYGVAIRGRRRRLRALLDLVDLSDHRAKKMSECSGGMQRRLALAATLVHEPQLLFLDEPTAGVDPILRERFWEHFRALRDRGRTVVVPTQYVGEAVSCDVVAVMAEGRLLVVLPPDQLAGFAYGGHPILVELDGWLPRPVLQRLRESDHVRSVQVTDAGMKVVVHGDLDDPATHLRQWLAAAGASVGEITSFEPSYADIFVEIIERHAGDGGGSAP
jgi:ABC-2 type transport system ATP-binding protein